MSTAASATGQFQPCLEVLTMVQAMHALGTEQKASKSQGVSTLPRLPGFKSSSVPLWPCGGLHLSGLSFSALK
jgi:hypothetical protein